MKIYALYCVFYAVINWLRKGSGLDFDKYGHGEKYWQGNDSVSHNVKYKKKYKQHYKKNMQKCVLYYIILYQFEDLTLRDNINLNKG